MNVFVDVRLRVKPSYPLVQIVDFIY